MSWQARLINPWLRLTERPALARARDPQDLRRSFERKGRLFFHPPARTRFTTTRLGQLSGTQVIPGRLEPGRLVLYFHGGGYIFGSPRVYRALVAQVVRRCGAKALLPAYPLAPEHPFPAAPDAAFDVWRACLQAGWAPGQVVLGGDSAGGGLALSLLGRICAEGGPFPAGLFAFSPLTDMTFSGPSRTENAGRDVVLPAERAEDMRDMVLGGAAPDDPRASPLFAAFPAAPPVWISVGDTEILRDDALAMAERLRAYGGEVTLSLEHDLPHVWPLFHNYLPEARATLDALADWLRLRWPSSGDS